MQANRTALHNRTALATAIALGLTGVTAAQAGDTHSFRANTVGDQDSITFQGLERFTEIVEEKTDGDIDFSLHHSGALGDQVDGMESLQAGTLDVATVETPIDEVDPVLGATALPYLFRDREHVAEVIDGGFAEWADERLQGEDLRVVGLLEGGFRHITNDVRPIETPSDLEGITMRTPESSLRIRTFEQYGADASPLPFEELYTALQTGAFDGQENPIIWAQTENFYEVQDYLSLTGHVYTMTYVLMSEHSYQELTEEQREILAEAGLQAGDHTVEIGREADDEVAEFLESEGMEINEADVDSFVERSEPIWDEWIADLDEADRADAQELVDMIVELGE